MPPTCESALLSQQSAWMESEQSRSDAREWSSLRPELSDYDCQDMIQALTIQGYQTEPQLHHVVLTALLNIANQNTASSHRAAHIILCAYLPFAVRIGSRDHDVEEGIQNAIAALWESIVDFPLHRIKTSAHMVMISVVRSRVRRGWMKQSDACAHAAQSLDHPASSVQEDPQESMHTGLSTVRSSTDSSHELHDLMQWSVETGVLSSHDATLLAEYHSSTLLGGTLDTSTRQEIAQRWGVSWATLRQRVHRTKEKVREAIDAERLICTYGGPRAALLALESEPCDQGDQLRQALRIITPNQAEPQDLVA